PFEFGGRDDSDFAIGGASTRIKPVNYFLIGRIAPRQAEPQAGPRLGRPFALALPFADDGFGDLLLVVAVVRLQLPLVRLVAAGDRLRAGLHQRADGKVDVSSKRIIVEFESISAMVDNLPHADRQVVERSRGAGDPLAHQAADAAMLRFFGHPMNRKAKQPYWHPAGCTVRSHSTSRRCLARNT